MSKRSRSQINRANSKHSTGPKTAQGKKQSSLNALRHGLTGQIVVMPTEDLEAYKLHVEAYTEEYDPQGATEDDLVQSLADTAWRLNRVAALETNLLSLGIASDLSPVTNAPPQVRDAFAIVAALESQSKALSNLSMHSQRLSRQFERTVTQLRDLQATRQAKEKQELDNLLNIMEMYESMAVTYDPSDDGFAFSQDQINEATLARNRESLAEEALEHHLESAAA